MANKREFKKSIDALSSAIVDEMMISYYNVETADKDKIIQAITKIIASAEKARRSANRLFGKKIREFETVEAYLKAKSAFEKDNFDKAVADYNDALGEALKLYNEAMPKNDSGK